VVGIDLNLDDLVDQTIVLSGPTTIHRAAPVGTNPATIQTEILSMILTGGDVTLRAGAGGTPALLASSGTVTEQTGDNTQADSFFDVFFEIDLGAGQKVYNHTALHVAAVTTCAPPAADFLKVNPSPVSLFSQPVGGIEMARIITVKHSTFPKFGACCLPANGCVLNISDVDCHAMPGGHFLGTGSTSCTHNPNGSCKLGACCRPNNVCTLDTTYDECVKLGGRYEGDGSTACYHDAAGNCIPTVSEWGVVVMAMLVLTAGTIVVMRRRAAVA
jgi:hypothetical protein